MVQLKRIVFAITVISCIAYFQVNAQNDLHPIATKVQERFGASKNLESPVLLEKLPDQAQSKILVEDEVKEGTFFSLKTTAIKSLLKNPSDLLQLSLPVKGADPLELSLFKAEIFTAGFQVLAASNPDAPFPYSPGLYYWGTVNGDEHSLAAIAINEDEIMGFAQINGEIFTIGKLNETSNGTHIIYKEKDLTITQDLACGTDDDLHYVGNKVDGTVSTAEKSADNCVKMYIEVDYDIFVGKGGVTQATNYINNVFSQVAILYANEAINFTINEILVWDVVDPYTASSTSELLNQFRSHINGNFNGDLAHLVGYTGNGGIAYVDVLCNSTYGVGYSDINSSYSNVPTYSWTIEVLTHEIGHNLGSRHTHDCVWNGNNTAIDGCGPAAGYGNSCGGGPIPEKGTIMSYCHLVGGVGIDFNLGFGPQPGNLIRNEVYNASCLSPCSNVVPDDAGITSINVPTGTVCGNSISPQVGLFNFGSNNLTSVTIQYKLDGNATLNYNWTGNLSSNASTVVTLPAITFGTGSHTFSANTFNPNGVADGNTTNDASNSNFTRPADQTFYADADGDGFGDPNSTQVSCTQPMGFVTDNTDCNDNDGNAYPGASCNDGLTCTTNDVLDANCNCSGTSADSDNDGVCDALDICPGGDDNVDSDGDGTPDYCDCNPATESFSLNPLTHSGSGSSSTMVAFAAGSKNPSFFISGLDSKLNGNPNSRYIDKVSISYVNGNGTLVNYGTFSGDISSSINVDITSDVQSVTVSLEDGYDGNYNGTLSVSFGNISYCGAGPGCPDADNDGVCDADDICPTLDDNLIGTACDDGDICTINDVYGSNCLCAGTYADSDSDGVCDGEDICPGGDDNADSDGDGIPDFCDNSNCSNEITSAFSPNPLTHSGTGEAVTSVSFPAGNANVNFTINNLNAKLNGNPSKRYNEQATVTYIDGSGTSVTEGVYTGDAQSSANITINGEVQSVMISLTDIYDGDTGNEVMSISMTDVTSCLTTGSIFLGGGLDEDSHEMVTVYPNPVKDELYIRFENASTEGELVITNLLGVPISHRALSGESVIRIDLASMDLRSQSFFINIRIPGLRPITKRILYIK